MKILVVGAGAVGGFFGAGLLADGRRVTFLVRERRAEQLRQAGLIVRNPEGDRIIASPPTVAARGLDGSYDLVLLSCKAYDLEACIRDFAPGMHDKTLVLPLLNGMRHLDTLDAKLGAARVLGGLARVSTTLDAQGVIHQMGGFHALVYGSRGGVDAGRLAEVAAQLQVTGFTALPSSDIVRDMWEKWVFIAAAAALTSFMRGSVGDIIHAGAGDLAVRLLDECGAIAAENGYVPGRQSIDFALSILTQADSPFTASMFRDIESNSRIEGQHIVGDLLARSKAANPVLKMAHAHLQTYEARRNREMHSSASAAAAGSP